MRPPLSRLCQTVAVSVATILGTGILGLPVALHASGLRPFLVVFTFNLFAQIGIVIATCELLQRAHETDSPERPYHPVPADDTPSSPLSAPARSPPSLHSLAEHFLANKLLRAFFNFLVVSHFLTILAAYSLAGPQAFLALLPDMKSLPFWLVISIFVVICSSAVVFFAQALLPSLTVGTFLKSILLTLLVLLIFVRGLRIRQPIHENWNPKVLIDPFLMGTFALNGLANLMPVTFQACVDGVKGQVGDGPIIDRAFVRAYRFATILAIILCYILNIMWSTAILMCVPQNAAAAEAAAAANGMLNGTESKKHTVLAFLMRDVASARVNSNSTNLEMAGELGQISTIPLIEVLHGRHDKTDTIIAFLVNTFIALSITISFLVISVGMKHFIDGEAQSQSESPNPWCGYNFNRRSKYLVYFSIILLTAIGNPTALIKIMEGFITLAVNIECGLILIYMLYVSRLMTKEIAAPLSSTHTAMIIGYVGLYFSTTVVVDVVYFLPSLFT